MAARIIFVTGTDTGVGKTIFTALLLAHGLRRSRSILAMKPFCSGGRHDTELLSALQEHRLPGDLLNPFYFDEPVAPLVSQRSHGHKVLLAQAEKAVRKAAEQCETLLVEGSGGLLVPLGEKFNVLYLVVRLRCEVIVVSRNRLGTINHTLLTAAALKNAGVRKFKTVLMGVRRADNSSTSNVELIRELLAPNPLYYIPFLTGNLNLPRSIRHHARALSPVLERVMKLAG